MIFRMFPPTEPQTIEINKTNIIAQIDPLLDQFLDNSASMEGIKAWQKPMEYLVAVACTRWMPVLGMKYTTSEECIRCGLCIKRCPKQNIRMGQNRPVFGKQCIFCMRCINDCPTNAILYNKKKLPQYKCKET